MKSSNEMSRRAQVVRNSCSIWSQYASGSSPSSARLLEHVLRVLVVAHQEARVEAAEPLVAGDDVGADLLVGRAQVRPAVHVVDGGGEEEAAHGRGSSMRVACIGERLHFLHRQVVRRGEPGAVLELGRRVETRPSRDATLKRIGAERRLDRHDLPLAGTRAPPRSSRRPIVVVSRNTIVGQRRAQLRRRDHGQQRARAGSSSSAPARRTPPARPPRTAGPSTTPKICGFMSSISHSIDRRRARRRRLGRLGAPDQHAQHVRRRPDRRGRRRRSRRARPSSPESARTTRRTTSQSARRSASPAPSGRRRCRPARRPSSLTVAGAGTGNTPCAECTIPPPTFSGEQTMRSAPAHSSANTAPTMSMIESSAPTSCRWTFSTGIWWIAASASPSRWNIALARSRPAARQRRAVDQREDLRQAVGAHDGCCAVSCAGCWVRDPASGAVPVIRARVRAGVVRCSGCGVRRVLVDAELRRRHAGAQHRLGADVELAERRGCRARASDRRAAGRRRAARRAPCRRRCPRSSRNTARGSQLPRLLEAPVPRVAQDHVIHDVDPDQRAGRRQPPRQLHIVGTRRGIARRVIVKHHDRRRAANRRLPEHVARLRRPRCSACRSRAPPCASRGAWCRAGRCRTAPRRASRTAAADTPPHRAGLRICSRALGACASVRRPSSTRRDDLRRRARPMPAIARRDRRPSQRARPCSPPCAASKALATLERVAAARAVAEHERDQLVVAERRRAMVQQLLARPIVGQQVFHLISSQRSAFSGALVACNG